MDSFSVTSLPNSPGWSRWIERLRAATAGRFTIIRELGRGGFAAVFLAQQQQPSRRVAIKLLLPAHLDSAWALDHFRGESQKISEWRHQSVVTIYEVHEVDDLFFFVMSYVEGGSLHDLIAKLGPLSIPMASSVLAQVGSALQYAHRQGVTHRDIKPHNVLIDVDGGAVVTDFGIAKQSGGTSHTVTGMIFGTAPYMAPEQCETGATSIMSDQYALGILAYEMLTGEPPFTGPPTSVLLAHLQKQAPLLRTVRPDCPPALEAAVARMLSKSPSDRFPSIMEAMQAAAVTELPDYHPERTKFASAAREFAAKATHHVIELVSIPPTLEVGDRIPLKASAKTSGGDTVADNQIAWTSENETVAKFDAAKGELTALTPGYTTLFVRSGGAEQQVRVDVRPPQAATMQLTGPRAPMRVGQTTKLQAMVRSRNGLPVAGPTVWVSDDPALATVSPHGELRAIGVGRTRIRAQSDQVTSELWIDVTQAEVAEVRIVNAPSRLTIGDRRQLTTLVLDASDQLLSDVTLLWSSSDRKLATVSPTGLVTASAAGRVSITVACEAQSATIQFAVEEPQAVVVEVANAPHTLRAGDSVRLRAIARDAQGHQIDRAVEWITDNADVAKVSADGTLTAVSAGSAVVAASLDGITTAVVLEVTKRPVTGARPPEGAVRADDVSPIAAAKIALPDVDSAAPAAFAATAMFSGPAIAAAADAAAATLEPAPAAAAPEPTPAAITPEPSPAAPDVPEARREESKPVTPAVEPKVPQAVETPTVNTPVAKKQKSVASPTVREPVQKKPQPIEPPTVSTPVVKKRELVDTPSASAVIAVKAGADGSPSTKSGGSSKRWIGIAAVALLAAVGAFAVMNSGGSSSNDAPSVLDAPPVSEVAGTTAPPPAASGASSSTPAAGASAPTGAPTTTDAGKSVGRSFQVAGAPASLTVGDTIRLQLVTDAATLASARWTTSNPQIATVTARGLVRTFRPGSVVLTASSGDQRVAVPLDVQEKAVAEVVSTPAAPTTPTPTPTLGPPPQVQSPRPAAVEPPKVERIEPRAAGSGSPPPDAGALAAASAAARAADEESVRASVRKLVLDYAAALSSENINAALYSFPRMPDNERQAFETMFRAKTDLSVRYEIATLEVNGTTAALRINDVTEFVFADKSRCRMLFTDQISVEESAGRWRIVGINKTMMNKTGSC